MRATKKGPVIYNSRAYCSCVVKTVSMAGKRQRINGNTSFNSAENSLRCGKGKCGAEGLLEKWIAELDKMCQD